MKRLAMVLVGVLGLGGASCGATQGGGPATAAQQVLETRQLDEGSVMIFDPTLVGATNCKDIVSKYGDSDPAKAGKQDTKLSDLPVGASSNTGAQELWVTVALNSGVCDGRDYHIQTDTNGRQGILPWTQEDVAGGAAGSYASLMLTLTEDKAWIPKKDPDNQNEVYFSPEAGAAALEAPPLR